MNVAGKRAIDLGLASCGTCELVVAIDDHIDAACPRCGTALQIRKSNSTARSWAFLLAAVIMYVPANLLPIMRTEYFGNATPDTIMSGVVYFLVHGDWPLAIVIFVASVLVPLLKMLAITYFLVAISNKRAVRRREKGALYHVTQFIGRWSMIDVFVVALLASLVQFGALLSISADWGAFAFASVVVFSMIAAHEIDPRLLWDNSEISRDK